MITKFKEHKKGSGREDVIFQVLFFASIIVLAGFLVVSNWKINQKRDKLSEEITALEKEIQALEEQKKELESGISQTGEESYWEEKIREQGYIKEGENSVVVLPPEGTKGEETPAEKNLPERVFDKIKSFFTRIIKR